VISVFELVEMKIREQAFIDQKPKGTPFCEQLDLGKVLFFLLLYYILIIIIPFSWSEIIFIF